MITAEVVEAREFCRQILLWESRGPGDTDNAMRRVARRHGIEYGVLWSLRYRAPKRIWADVANAIAAAYSAEIERQRGKLDHAATIAEQTLGPDRASVRKAHAVLGRTAGASSSVVDAKRQRLNSTGDRT